MDWQPMLRASEIKRGNCPVQPATARPCMISRMTNKKFGRVGDSLIVGAGTYADNATYAVNVTGHGEYFF